MAKKILGDDPFRAGADASEAPTKTSQGKGGKPKPAPNKTKRAPSKKTEAPRAARATTKAAKPQPAAVTPPVVAPVAEAPVAAPPVAATIAPTTTTTSLTQRADSDEPPLEAAPGSWRWWRFRQQQLARAEEATWLARSESESDRDRFGRDPVLAGRAEPIVDVVYRSLLRVSVRGLGHVPETGRALLVARRRRASFHGVGGSVLGRLVRMGLPLAMTTPLDAAIIGHAIRTEHVAHREVRPLVRAARLYTPLLGVMLRRLGGVPADVHDLARLLDDERLALAFVDDPAGPPAGVDLDLKTLVCLALVTGAPIVPVSVKGGVPGRFLGGDGLTAIAFGTPLYHGAEFGPDGAEDAALVARLTDELAAQIAPV